MNKKTKSDLIFWIVFGLIAAFLFLTPWGSNTRSWISSLFLSSPELSENNLQNSNKEILSTDWNLEGIDGENIWLSDTDKPIFINIWATWCGPCRSELPSIKSLHEKYKGRVTFLLVSPDESIEVLNKFESKNEYQLPFYNAISYTPKELQTNSYPTTIILDADKNIIYKITGAHDWDTEDVHKIFNGLIN